MSSEMRSNLKETASWPGPFSLRELACVLTVTTVLALVIILSGSQTVMRWRLELAARNWKPTAADRLRPDESLLSPEMEIAGRWSARLGKSLLISLGPTDDWTIILTNGNCTGNCEISRVGRFENGVLELDRALAESESVVYDKLFAVRIDDTDFLLPGDRVERTRKELGSSENDMAIGDRLYGCVYQRLRIENAK